MGHVVVMGVTGSGKTTLGFAMAKLMEAAFVDAEDLLSEDNIKYLTSGRVLPDEMCWPWLDACGAAMKAETDCVMACSVLRRSYRNYLRELVPGVRLVYPRVTATIVRNRLAQRQGYFTPGRMIRNQFDQLEAPDADERPVLIPSGLPTERAAKMAVRIITAR